MIPEFEDEDRDDGIDINPELFDTDFDDVGFFPDDMEDDSDSDAAELLGY